jgi:TPR repeat protein
VLFLMALMLAPQSLAGTCEDFEEGKRAFRAGDIVTAMGPLKRASQAGHAGAQALYAQILDRSEFNEEAVAWFRKSAEQNDPDGQYGLGSMLAAGEGVERDLVAARGWMEKAAIQGHVLAINLLAQSYINGQLGLTAADRASPQALPVLTRAAEIDFLPAIEALAQAYVSGGYGAVSDPAAAVIYAAKLRARPGARTAKAGRK